MVLGLLDPDLLVRGMNPDPTSKNSKKRLIPTALRHLFDVLSGVPDLCTNTTFRSQKKAKEITKQ